LRDMGTASIMAIPPSGVSESVYLKYFYIQFCNSQTYARLVVQCLCIVV